ncbi:MAG: hypothetical protein ACJAXR_000939 [Halopseudomonas sp.]|jgi:hypothetical protein|uniref:hypothetical protein n=1 Tax=Halopseudomonas sp. TaxID=2901191 RepID=UPI0039E41DAE
MDRSQVKSMLHAHTATARAAQLEAKVRVRLPDDPSAALDEWERNVKEWTDHPSLPQKERALKLVRMARKALQDHDEDQLKTEFLLIVKIAGNYHADLWALNQERKEDAAKTGGATGGRQPKRRLWAEAAANYLIDSYGRDLALAEYIEKLPESFAPVTVEHDDTVWQVYRDGGEIVVVTPSAKSPPKITFKQFREKYLSPARNSPE